MTDAEKVDHTTHYACEEQIKKYGGKTIGCCCTGHQCKRKAGQE